MPDINSGPNQQPAQWAFALVNGAWRAVYTGDLEIGGNLTLGGRLSGDSVNFQQSGAGAALLTQQAKSRQIINAADFAGFDGTGLTSSTAAIQAAINQAAARGFCDVMIPRGARTGALTIPNSVGLVGPSTKATLIAEAGSYITLNVTGSDCVVQNLDITETAKSGGATLAITCGTTGKDRNTFANIITRASHQLFADSGSGSGAHTTSFMKNIQAKAHRGPGVIMTRGFAFLELDHVIIDYVGVAASNFTGFNISGAGLPPGAGGLIMERCDVLGTMGVFTNAAQHGYILSNLAAVRIRNTRADTCGGNGWDFQNVNGLLADDIASGLNDGHGMLFTGCNSVLMNKVFVFGRNYLTTPTAARDGIRFVSGNVGVTMATVLTRDNTGNGINKVAAQAGGIQIANAQMFANTLRGVASVGNSAFTLVGAQFDGNLAGNYSLGGGFDYMSGVQLASGAFFASLGPGPITG